MYLTVISLNIGNGVYLVPLGAYTFKMKVHLQHATSFVYSIGFQPKVINLGRLCVSRQAPQTSTHEQEHHAHHHC